MAVSRMPSIATSTQDIRGVLLATFSASKHMPSHRALLAVGTATYDHPDFAALHKVPKALAAIVETLMSLGFDTVTETPGYTIDPTVTRLRSEISMTASAAPIAVIYYTGHGVRPERDTYYLVSKHSQLADLGGTALPARELLTLLTCRDEQGNLVEDQPCVLVILDCCYSGSAGIEMLSEALHDVGNPDTWVIASSGSLEYAEQGIFAAAFCDVLRRPTTGPSTRFLSLDSIIQAVNDKLSGNYSQQARVFAPIQGSLGIPPFFVNPDYRPGLAGLTVSEQHWLSRVRGTAEDSTIGFYLSGRTGRVRATEELAAWISGDHGGLAVVTGSPGTGKSALLALPVLLAQPSSREDLLRAAGPSSLIRHAAALIHVETSVIGIHARGLNTDQVAGTISRALNRLPRTASTLLEDLDNTPEASRCVVIVDAVDEAISPTTLLGSLLLPLSRQHGLRIAVGARRNVPLR